MGFWTKVEKWSEKNIEGFFKKKFAGPIQPAEIAKMIAREMRDKKTVSVSKIYIPNEYIVYIGEEDWEKVTGFRESLSRELRDFVTTKAEQRKYAMVGPPQVRFEEQKDLETGVVEVKGRFTEVLPDFNNNTLTVSTDKILDALEKNKHVSHKGDASISEDTIVSSDIRLIASVTVKINGVEQQTYPLGLKPVVLGRKRSSDIPLLDENVSRHHAKITYSDGFHYICDLGSTNGVFVNGKRIIDKKLVDGDVIKLGSTIMEYKVI